MSFHLSALLTVSLFACAAITVCYSAYVRLRVIKPIGVAFLLVCLLAISIRLLFPYEHAFMKSVPITIILPSIMRFLRSDIGVISGILITPTTVLAVLWVIVSIALFLQVIKQYFHFRKLVADTAMPQDKQSIALLNAIKDKNIYKEKISFIVSDTIPSPMIFGYFHPVIVLPSISLSYREWKMILWHEMNHYYHGDLWIKLVMKIIQIVYWWNPLSYLLSQLVSELLEIRNDKQLLRSMAEEEHVEYFRCLLKVAKSRKHKCIDRLALAFDSQKKSLAIRRFRLIGTQENTQSTKSNLMLIAAVVSVIMMLFLTFSVVFEPSSMPIIDSAGNFTVKSENAYMVYGENGIYDIYIDGKYIASINKIRDNADTTIGSLADLPVYNSVEEVSQK